MTQNAHTAGDSKRDQDKVRLSPDGHAMEWLLAAIVFFIIEACNVAFPCTLDPKWGSLVFGIPLSVAGGMLVVGILRLELGKKPFPIWAWVIDGLLALLGLPLYLLGHLCG